MKKTKAMLLLTLAGTVTFSLGLWLYSTMERLTLIEYALAILVLITVIFSMVIGFKRLKDEKKGLAVEDEFSRRVKQKAAANAFIVSFYLWTMIALFISDANIRSEILIGLGILGMGLLFIGFWIYYSKIGISNENQD